MPTHILWSEGEAEFSPRWIFNTSFSITLLLQVMDKQLSLTHMFPCSQRFDGKIKFYFHEDRDLIKYLCVSQTCVDVMYIFSSDNLVFSSQLPNINSSSGYFADTVMERFTQAISGIIQIFSYPTCNFTSQH